VFWQIVPGQLGFEKLSLPGSPDGPGISLQSSTPWYA
jgi:hypothetical protein